MNAISSATTGGMVEATQQLNAIATNVASGSRSKAEETVAGSTASAGFQANLNVQKSAHRMSGAILDIRA